MRDDDDDDEDGNGNGKENDETWGKRRSGNERTETTTTTTTVLAIFVRQRRMTVESTGMYVPMWGITNVWYVYMYMQKFMQIYVFRYV